MFWLLVGFVGVVGLAGALVGLGAFGARRWSDETQRLTGHLTAEATDCATAVHSPPCFDECELQGLPAPVQRYFRAVLTAGQPIIATATIDLAGTINMSAVGQRWKRFASRQWVATGRPGFLWDAEVAMLPGLAVRVRDGYAAGEGRLHASALGLFTVADVRGGGEIARGELIRYFAEMAWYPTALLPSQGVRWEAVDDRSARAVFVDGPTTLSLLFAFNDAGLIDSARAEARGATIGKKTVMIPWEGRWSDYEVRAGMIVPLIAEAAWLPPEGRRPYFRGTVTSLHYEFAT